MKSNAKTPPSRMVSIFYPSFDKAMDAARKAKARANPNKDAAKPASVNSRNKILCTRTAKNKPTPSFSPISATLFLCPLSMAIPINSIPRTARRVKAREKARLDGEFGAEIGFDCMLGSKFAKG